MMQILIDKQPDTVIIRVDPAVMKVYDAEAKQRGLPSGTALIEAIIADWQAMIAPVVLPTPIVFAEDNPPFGSGF